MVKRILKGLFVIGFLFQAGPLWADRLRSVTGTPEEQTRAVNVNFKAIDHELSNTVHKTSTETISGYKYFTNNADFTTVTADTVTATNIVMDSPFSMRNRIINGDMRLDQRLAGTASGNNPTYYVDRWRFDSSGAVVVRGQQSSSIVPASFNFSSSSTIITADASMSGGDYLILIQPIEGYNVADFLYGTSLAKSATLSFWIRTDVAGTYSGSLRNSAANRSYVFTYTIDAVDTWEQKKITISGDTSGTWLSTNGVGIYLQFCFGVGTTLSTSSVNSWVSGNFIGSTSQTNNLIGTAGNQYFLTGVQLEEGEVATPFERRFFPVELQLCQRYYEKSYNLGTAAGATTTVGRFFGSRQSGTFVAFVIFKTRKRAAPTMTIWSDVTGAAGFIRNQASSADEAAGTETSEHGVNVNGTTATVGHGITFQWAADAEL